MIYEFPEISRPIRPGDIFAMIPRADVSLRHLAVLGDNGTEEVEWSDLAEESNELAVILPVSSVFAIVASQDCDTIRSSDITLCEIRPFPDVEGKAKSAKKPKSWVSLITQHARMNLKWFYLPPDERLGFREKMAVDFAQTIRVPRVDLENFKRFRSGRLNDIADEHFRERLAEFFRRYPYDEWYSLDKDEWASYSEQYPEAKPFPWQS